MRASARPPTRSCSPSPAGPGIYGNAACGARCAGPRPRIDYSHPLAAMPKKGLRRGLGSATLFLVLLCNESGAPVMKTGSRERNHARPPLGKRPHIDVVFAHELELAVRAHAEHGEPRREVHHLVALPPCGGCKRSGHQEARTGVEPERARMR